ncbi:MAG: protein phosphatase 2C domain-containing protein [Lentisphaeria bacterium]|nr:protein phosphatase 2C domain-containing protein [Lentisphaeria bacterium]
MSDLRGFAVSVPGNGHIRREIPCQDASGVWLSPRPCMIVCDGRGSARFSHFGAQAAVAAFRTQCAVMEDLLAAVLDGEKWNDNRWLRFCDLMIRTACQKKVELAEKFQCPGSEFDFTIAFAVWGKARCGFFQVGDGAITVWEGTECCYSMFPPDKGEFDNETRFLRPEAEISRDYHARLVDSGDINGIAITSDGPEFLMFELASMTPGPIFNRMFDDCTAGQLTRQDLLDYLTRTCWSRDPRGNDDRSLAILTKTENDEISDI